MNRPYRVAIICGSLAQAGTERYVYELCRALDRTRFLADVLTIAPWGVGRQFYAQPIRELGSRIRPILPLFYFRSFPRPLRPPLLAAQSMYRWLVLPRLLAKYDLLVVVHLDYLSDVDFMLPRNAALVVHLTTHLRQHRHDYYSKWPHHRRGSIICMDNVQQREATAGLGNVIIDKTVVGLPVDTSQFTAIDSWPEPRRLVVGCFIRIEPDRHPLPILRAFAALATKTDAELRFYGRGDASHLRVETERLGIASRVKFPGHVGDLRRAVVEDGVTFGWGTAEDAFFGYSGIELALLGVPTYFCNLGTGKSPERILRETDGAVHSFSSEAQLAEETLAAWQDPDRLWAEALRLRRYVQEYNDSRHVVRQMEAFYLQAMRRSQMAATCDSPDAPNSRVGRTGG